MTSKHDEIKPPVTEVQIRELAKRLYGLDVVNAKKLGGFEDSNWYIKVDSRKTCRHDVPEEDNDFMIKVVIGRESTQPGMALIRMYRCKWLPFSLLGLLGLGPICPYQCTGKRKLNTGDSCEYDAQMVTD
jgi:hypothetical protein